MKPGQLGFDLDDRPAGGGDLVADHPVGDERPALDCARNHPAADLVGGYWRGFTADHPVGDAVARFRQRFGRDPEQVLQDHGVLLVGPV